MLFNKNVQFAIILSLSSLNTGMAHFWTSVLGYTTSFDWASDKLSHVWVRPFLKDLKSGAWQDRARADRTQDQNLTAMQIILIRK